MTINEFLGRLISMLHNRLHAPMRAHAALIVMEMFEAQALPGQHNGPALPASPLQELNTLSCLSSQIASQVEIWETGQRGILVDDWTCAAAAAAAQVRRRDVGHASTST
jgi:hypothetical protein